MAKGLITGTVMINGVPYSVSATGTGDAAIVNANGDLITTTSFTLPEPFTAEDEKELAALEKTRQAQQPLARAQAFKTLPRSEREFLIDATRTCAKCNSIRDAEMPKTPRQQELESKKNKGWVHGAWTTSGFVSIQHTSFNDLHLNPEKIFNTGMTLEEMEKAHADACAEEILLHEDYKKPASNDGPYGGC